MVHWLFGTQTVLEEHHFTRICALFTYLIPMTGFAFAHNRLVLNEAVANWLNIGLVIAGQIIFLLILITIIEPTVEALARKHVRSSGQHDRKRLQTEREVIEKVGKRMRDLGRALLFLVPLLTVLSYVDLVPDAIWTLPGMILIIKVMCGFRIMRVAKRRSGKSEVTTIKFESSLDEESPQAPNDPDIKVKRNIVEFFLNIFRHQIGAPKEAPTEFRLVDSRSFAPNYIYELRVNMRDDWQSRRMTIGPLGDDTTSRSKCFYVIYDYHLVIKIPPVPIKDLNEYIKIIRKEQGIVNKLSMKECIIPTVSVILKMLPRLSGGEGLPVEETEENYVRRLNVFSELQEYLRIDDTFAFFMDLSKYYFLQNIIESFHATNKPLYTEICKDSELAWDYLKFEEKYGNENTSIFLEIEKVYRKYESEIKNLAKKYDISAAASQYQIKEWFFIHLAGGSVTKSGKTLKEEFISVLNALVKRMIDKDIRSVDAYRTVVGKYISEASFTQNKAYMEGIITNLLELLAHLREQNVAMRDLKPDNLLVAGNRERHPTFLAYPEEYKIGLIDVETAVIIAGSSHAMIAQPLLGGTPQYATPSHLFNNQLLSRVYKDLPLILHLQDWYAIIAVIYKAVMGHNLFESTAQLFPKMVTAINEVSKKGNGLIEMAIITSQMFWNCALSEFKTKMAEKMDKLKSLEVLIEDSTKKMFKDFVLSDTQEIAQRIDQCVNSKDIPISLRERQYLTECSNEKVCKLRENWVRRSKTPKTAVPIDSSRIVSFLENLVRLKSGLELKKNMLHLLDQSPLSISTYKLLKIMFEIVLKHMYREEWRVSVADTSGHVVHSDTDISYQTATEATREWPTV